MKSRLQSSIMVSSPTYAEFSKKKKQRDDKFCRFDAGKCDVFLMSFGSPTSCAAVSLPSKKVTAKHARTRPSLMDYLPAPGVE